MAIKGPVLKEDKIEFYRKKLWREVSNLFKWEGMPPEMPVDYLERTLVRTGRALFFYDEATYGYMALETTVRGQNIYKQPTEALSIAPNLDGKNVHFERKIVHKYDKDFDKNTAAVLINNMYNGESLFEIVEHYARRLTLIQNAFDTNTVWQNIPVTWSVTDEKMKLSIEQWYDNILSGEPMIIMDKTLLGTDNEVIGNVTEVPFLLDKLYDVKNEIYNEFKSTIGLDAPGADKKERLVVAEATSNEESKDTCLNIMLNQRLIACEEINKVFGLNITVSLAVEDKEEVNEDGTDDNGTEDPAKPDKL